jgi:hypothetical protein
MLCYRVYNPVLIFEPTDEIVMKIDMRLSYFPYSDYFCLSSYPVCLSPYVSVLHTLLAFVMKAEYSFEMSISIYQTTPCHIPKDNLIYS